MSARVMARGMTVGWLPAGVGEDTPGLIAEGANGGMPAKNSGWEEDPACHSWVKMIPPAWWTASVTLDQAWTWASLNSPGTSCQPTASRLIQVPSVMIKPAEARWV